MKSQSTVNSLHRADKPLRLQEGETTIILNNMKELVAYQNTKNIILWANKATAKAFSLTFEQLIGSVCYEIFHHAPNPCAGCPVIKARQTGKPEKAEMISPDGRIWLIEGIPTRGTNGNVNGVIEVTSEITNYRLKEKALRDSEIKYRSLVGNALEGIGISKGNQVVFANKALLEIFGYKELTEFLAVPLLGHVARECRPMIKERMEKRKKGEPLPPRFEYRIIRKDGAIRDLEISTAEVTLGDEKYVQSTFRDITERKNIEVALRKLSQKLMESNKKLKSLALRDSQTGLYNHRYLGEVIEAEFHRAIRYAHPLSLMMLDIDYFKSINDAYGHQFGDLVLRQLAGLLKRMVRRYDAIIRFGGEEFVIVSSGIDKAAALVLAQRILDTINLYNFGNDKDTVKLKLSIAVASYPQDKMFKGMDLIELAEQILNKVKEGGGNRVYSSSDINQKKSLGEKEEQLLEEIPEVKSLKEKIDKLTKQSNQSLVEAIFAFAKAIEVKDHSTGAHVEKTVRYATETARALSLDKDQIGQIGQAAILHDLGKVGISEKILLKKTKLTHKEWDEIKKHPHIGIDIIRPIQFLHNLIPLILYHHERWDGNGYPSGLKGEQIPIGARIIAVADVYQALISDRPYRRAYAKSEAVRIIKNSSAKHFDPQVVDIFLKIIKER